MRLSLFIFLLHITVCWAAQSTPGNAPDLPADVLARIVYGTGDRAVMVDLGLRSRGLQPWFLDPLAVPRVVFNPQAGPEGLYAVLRRAASGAAFNPFLRTELSRVVYDHTRAKRLIDDILRLDNDKAVELFRILIDVFQLGLVADLAFSVTAFWYGRGDLLSRVLQLAPVGSLRPADYKTTVMLDHTYGVADWMTIVAMKPEVKEWLRDPDFLYSMQRNLLQFDLWTFQDVCAPTAQDLIRVYPWLKKDDDDGGFYGYHALRLFLFRRTSRSLPMVRDLLKAHDFIPVVYVPKAADLIDDVIRANDVAALCLLRQHPFYLGLMASGAYYPLHLACWLGRVEAVDVLVRDCVVLDWNERDADRKSLRECVRNPNLQKQLRNCLKQIINDQRTKRSFRNLLR